MRRHMAILILSCSLGLGRPPQGALAGIDAQALGAPLAGGRTTAGAGVLSSGLESFKADLFMGIASYRIPIRVPPGTAGMQPDLALTYRSGGSDGWVGFGWDLGVPAIRRSTKFGVPRYADDAADPAHDRFVLGDDNLAEFSEIDYATELESYARIRRVNRGTAEEFWEVTRGDGRVLVFGDTAGTRIEKAPGQIFAWLLHTETDVLGNGLTYAYDTTTDPGVAYLSQITYTSHPGEAAMNTRTVSFTLESRPDPFLTCQAGFPQQTNFRLGQITVALGGQLVRRYDLIYATSPSGRSLLEEIRMVGSDGQTAAPAQKFAYQTFETGFRAPSDWLNPSAADDYVALRPATAVGNADYALLDLTGDGLPDRVTRDKQDDLLWKVYPNRGDGQGFQEIPLAWPNPSAGEASQNRTIRSLSGSGDVLAEILDLDGDGRPDRVTKGLGGDKFNLRFFRNTGEAFAPGVDWPDPAGLGKVRKVNTTGSGFAVFADLIDMNGDGLPDRVSKNDGSSWLVYLHTGAGFAEDPILWSVPTDTSGKLVWDDGGTKADVFDINGDGLPDRILATDHNATSWTVHFGTGWGFMAQGYAWPNPSYAITEGDGTKIRDADGSGNLRVTVADMNGDGLVDRVVSDKSAGTFVVWPSSGMGFSPAFWVWGNPSAGDNHPQVIDVENQVTVADLVISTVTSCPIAWPRRAATRPGGPTFRTPRPEEASPWPASLTCSPGSKTEWGGR